MERYSSDLKDKEWEQIKDLFKEKKTGRPRQYDHREMLNGVLYVVKTGCQWRNIPKEFPPWNTVFYYFKQWSEAGVIEEMHARLRKKK